MKSQRKQNRQRNEYKKAGKIGQESNGGLF